MELSAREKFNAEFTAAKYQACLQDIYSAHNHIPNFRIAESPVFINKTLKAKILQACDDISETICHPKFKEWSQGALHPDITVGNEDEHTLFLQMDFGICVDEKGELSPQLIEVQGFPSLYFFQHLLARTYRKHYDIPEHYHYLFSGLSDESYLDLLRRNILAGHRPENVLLLEVKPEEQNTKIDFYAAAKDLGVPVRCLSDVKVEGEDIYYINDQGQKTQVHRIFNRVIFDELINYKDLKREFYFSKPANVEWAGHPNWFYRISKHTLPLLNSPYVPKTYYLKDLERMPDDLHNYVLKPLFSFSGAGVKINVSKEDIEAVQDPTNYILQRKVEYAPVIKTPSGPAKFEIRMLMLWEKGAKKPTLMNNLVRLTKGEMVGVKYNLNKDWVGGSIAFFEK